MPGLRSLRPLRHLLFRAIVLYVVLRPMLELMGKEIEKQGGISIYNPIGVVGLIGALGVLDVRRRAESMLWANLGFARWVPLVLFAGVAALAELLLAWLR